MGPDLIQLPLLGILPDMFLHSVAANADFLNGRDHESLTLIMRCDVAVITNRHPEPDAPTGETVRRRRSDRTLWTCRGLRLYFEMRSCDSAVPIWLNTVLSWPEDVTV